MNAARFQPEARCQTTPGMLWTVEPEGVAVGDSLRHEWVRLAYPEAAVWDLLARGRTKAETATLVRWIAALAPAEAEALVEQCLKCWQEEARLRPWPTSP